MKKENFFDEVENSINGYKYMVGMVINAQDPLGGFESGEDKLCICDTRDECVEFIRKDIERNTESYKKDPLTVNIYSDPYNITRLGTIVKWHDGEKSWFWTYGIYPVRYIHEEN